MLVSSHKTTTQSKRNLCEILLTYPEQGQLCFHFWASLFFFSPWGYLHFHSHEINTLKSPFFFFTLCTNYTYRKTILFSLFIFSILANPIGFFYLAYFLPHKTHVNYLFFLCLSHLSASHSLLQSLEAVNRSRSLMYPRKINL